VLPRHLVSQKQGPRMSRNAHPRACQLFCAILQWSKKITINSRYELNRAVIYSFGVLKKLVITVAVVITSFYFLCLHMRISVRKTRLHHIKWLAAARTTAATRTFFAFPGFYRFGINFIMFGIHPNRRSTALFRAKTAPRALIIINDNSAVWCAAATI